MCRAIPYKINNENIINLALVNCVELDIYNTKNGYQYRIVIYFGTKDSRHTIHFEHNLEKARLEFNQILSAMKNNC